MNFARVNTILRKEILDTLRDKRTLIMMVAVPVLLYPAMMMLTTQMAIVQHTKLEGAVSRVAILADDPAPVAAWFEEAVPEPESEDSESDAEAPEADETEEEAEEEEED